jgi:hypothetical protein
MYIIFSYVVKQLRSTATHRTDCTYGTNLRTKYICRFVVPPRRRLSKCLHYNNSSTTTERDVPLIQPMPRSRHVINKSASGEQQGAAQTLPQRSMQNGGVRSSMSALPEVPPPPMSSRETSQGSHMSSARFESYTEAVPLSLSSLAHASLPLDDGVLDGVNQVLSHTLLSCVNYARMIHPPHQWTFRDLCTSPFAWGATKEQGPPRDLPFSLTKLNFQHHYTMRAGIYLRPALNLSLTREDELERLQDWPRQVGILGCIKLLYASTEALTPDELNGTDTEDVPPTILYKVIVEYRSLPATGKTQAVQAEELSMLSFGGSIDDDVKYGALAALYDKIANYVLEIYSVRGKKYKFDLMDATLSDGTVPRLPSSASKDAFAKSLCATVTDHSFGAGPLQDKKYAITRMHLTLEGKIRVPMEELPRIDAMASSIATHFRCLAPSPMSDAATANPSGHTLLLDPAYAGRIYVNGRYITTWGQDTRIGSHGIALFGMDMHSIPVWHGKIVDFEAMKRAYGQLWHEILIDARLLDLEIGKKLLHRLMFGRDPDAEEDDEGYDDEAAVATNVPCLEAQVLSSPEYDRVGIAPKALGTRFLTDFGRNAYPCREEEVQWVKTMLPDKKPVVVPERLIPVLRRGGFFDVQRAHDDLWFVDTRRPKEVELPVVTKALELLALSGCDEIAVEQVVIVGLSVAEDLVAGKAVCRYKEVSQMFCIHEKFFTTPSADWVNGADCMEGIKCDEAFLLGLQIAQAHPDGKVLARYVLRNRS